MVNRKEFDYFLKEMDTALHLMGDEVRKAIKKSLSALIKLDTNAADQVIENDKNINKLEENILNIGTRLIATQQPVAKDLRRILAAFKISSDLERMADLAVDVAKSVKRLKGQTLVKPLVDIPKMAEMAIEMVEVGMEAYANEDLNQAFRLSQMDDGIDLLYSQTLQELFTYMSANPETINQAMLLSFVGRYIERIGDHATNIGESVAFLVNGTRPDLN